MNIHHLLSKNWSKTLFTMLLLGSTGQTAVTLPAPAQSLSQSPSPLAPCQKDMDFQTWMNGLKKEALAKGITVTTLNLAQPFMVFDPAVIKKDGNQGVFQLSFLQFSDRLISNSRIRNGAKLISTTYKDLFLKIENDFGVPPQAIVALWALESDFGAFTGNFQILSSVTTLAYDCRRADFFRKELLDALALVQRADLPPQEMIGNWAGELGGTQFMASDYLESGVDYDGDGKVNLVKSIPDTLASTANFLKNHGWQRGQPWLQEVHVPAQLAWQEADIAIQHPVSQWQGWGVSAMKGASLPSADLPASLLLPMGRLGPAFLAYPNFQAFLSWNSSSVYSTTAAYLALRMSGAKAIQRGSPSIVVLSTPQVIELQNLLIKRGHLIGEADGKLGAASKSAIKLEQIKMNLPADSYPTPELIEKLKADQLK